MTCIILTVICIDYGGKSVTNIICKVFWNRVDFGNTEPISAGRWTDSIASVTWILT